MSQRTRVIAVKADDPDPSSLAEAADLLRVGGLVAFATETVYGLGADATNPDAVARIFEAKGRPAFNPLIVHGDRTETVRPCTSSWPECADILAARFWPGPLTLVLPRAGFVPDIVTAGRGTVAVRVPGLPLARRLIARAGRPIAAPSANRSTGLSPTQASHVLKDLDGRIGLVLDSGPTAVGIESTVLDLTVGPPRILRPGTITRDQLREALGFEVQGHEPGAADSTSLSSPGQMAIHYAPRTPMFRLDPEKLATLPEPGRWGMISIGLPPGLPRERGPIFHIRLLEPKEAENRLYGSLHSMDSHNLDFLMIVPPPDEPRWSAIRDRIRRASQPWPEAD